MCNEQIIFNESIKLMEAGIIGSTGRTIMVETDQGEKISLQEPEAIHTFQGWKELGFSVRKNEHAISSFPIWKHVVKKSKEPESEAEEKMFLTKAFFFKFSQVEPMGRENKR